MLFRHQGETMGLQRCLSLVQHHVEIEDILRSPSKQLKYPFVWLAPDVLPQVASCLTFISNHYLVNRLFRSLWHTPESSVQEAELWPDLEESVTCARDQIIVIEVDKPLHQPESFR